MSTHERVRLCGLEAVMKEYTSPMVCVVLKRAGRRVPSPNRICNERVGCDSFTSTTTACVVAEPDGAAAGAGAGAGSAVLFDIPGVGLPSL